MSKFLETSFFLNKNKNLLIQKYENNINNLNKDINSFVHLNDDFIFEDENILINNKRKKIKGKVKFNLNFNLENNREENQAQNYFKLFKGVPIAIKDNICYNKLETTCCSDILKGYYPSYNADVVEYIINAGGLIVGNTNMDEFAMGSTTETSCYGPTKNPLNYYYIPGGSSGGSAAAVSSDMVPLALGSDTGGSVRQPASLCGIYGFKPSWGAISRYGLIAFASSLDQIGIFSKSAFDLLIFFNLISIPSKNDMTNKLVNKGKEYNDFVKSLNYENIWNKYEEWIRLIKLPKKIGIFKGIEKYITCNYTKKLYLDKIDYFKKSLNIEIEEITLDFDFNDILGIYYIIAPAEASSNLARYDSLRVGKNRENGEDLFDIVAKTRYKYFNNEVKRRINIGNFVLSAGYKDMYYKKALILRELIKRKFDEIFKKVEIIFLPTTPSYLKKIGEEMDPIDIYSSDIFTVLANIIEVPAISFPDSNNPDNNTGIGFQLIGNKYNDYKLIEIVNYLEYID